MHPVSLTAQWVAAARARESARTDALFRDVYAQTLAGEEGAGWDASEESAVGAVHVALRTRFFDDELLDGTLRRGIRQIVILAAGMDARAFRLPFPRSTHVYELDRPDLLAIKEAILGGMGAEPVCQRSTLGVDLTADWDAALTAIGFSPERPTAWLVEGLLPYLEESDVHALLSRVHALSSIGSVVALDVPGTAFCCSAESSVWVDKLRARGITWHFASDEPATLVEEHGFSVTNCFSLDELAAKYGRGLPWPASESKVFARAFFVSAVRNS